MNMITSEEVAKQENSCEMEMNRAKRDLNASLTEVYQQKRGVKFNNLMLRETDKQLRTVVFGLKKLTGI